MTEHLSDEIIKRARIDAGIIIVDEPTTATSSANETNCNYEEEPDTSDEE